MEGDAGSADE